MSPKTEYLWFDALESDTAGRAVASMRMQLRPTGELALTAPQITQG